MTRAIYSMVHEGYDVCLYRTIAGVCREAVATELCLDNSTEDEPQPCTAAEVRKALKQEGSVRLYPLQGGDWKYRIQKHAGFWDETRRPSNQKERSKARK